MVVPSDIAAPAMAPAAAPVIPAPVAMERPRTVAPASTAKTMRAVKAARDADATDGTGEHDSDAVTLFSEILDRSLTAAAARLTLGLSPAALLQAYLDWTTHLAFSPGKRLQLIDKATQKGIRFANYVYRWLLENSKAKPCIEPLPQDRRFRGEDWQKWPFDFIYQAFLLNQQWWHNFVIGVRGVSKQHEIIVEFVSRQILDMFSPSNFPSTNPEILDRTFRTGGINLISGAKNWIEDWERAMSGKKPAGAENFRPGRDVAVTPGKVIYRNQLIELIQYAPATNEVRPEPVLIVPAWIMKYYILDLSPHSSLVKYLVDRGFTVFLISWKNPSSEDRNLSLNDYRSLGVMAAIDAVRRIVPDQLVHAVGYCLGGTLLSIAAAAMARDGDHRLKSLTLLAAQTDFTEAGEMMLFINESQLAFLEDLMWEQGFLDASQMAGAFQMLQSNDLIWSRILHEYLLGERPPMTALMAWNADSTRMPYRMPSEYLRDLFLNNDLAEGRFLAADKPVALSDIRVPIFAVGTLRDHVAPWRSTYKIHLLTDTDVTYLLTSGSHNSGIVSEPGHPRRSFQVMTKKSDGRYHDPQSYLAEAPRKEGSWWPEWAAWLAALSGSPATPPLVGAATEGFAPLCDAPGTYVFQQ